MLYWPLVFGTGATAMSVSPPAGEKPTLPLETLSGNGKVVKWFPLSVDFQAKVPPQRPPMTQKTFSEDPYKLPAGSALIAGSPSVFWHVPSPFGQVTPTLKP